MKRGARRIGERIGFGGPQKRDARHGISFKPLFGRHLGFESLEERHLLATLTVNSPLDNVMASDGLVTLREAILAANSNTTTDLGETGNSIDAIVFDATAFATLQTISLSLGELEISEALSIAGTGASLLTIDAQQNSRIFNITAATGDVEISGLTITHGRTTGNNVASDTTFSGGAIRFMATGKLTVSNCVVADNRTEGSNAAGGAIFVRRTLMLVGSTVSENSTLGSGAGGGIAGGGNFDPGSISVTDSVVTGNNARGSGGGIAIANSNITLTNSLVNENLRRSVTLRAGESTHHLVM